MLNILLFLGILLFLLYSVYDQFGMDTLKGKTLLKVKLVKQSKTDSLILIALIVLIIYQSLGGISSLTLYLLVSFILLIIYGAFIRSPVLVLKEKGFFFGNLYFEYTAIHQINLAEENILVIDLKRGKRLLVRIVEQQDRERVVQFFGGYKEKEK